MKWGADRMSDGAVCRSNEQRYDYDMESTAGRDNDEDIKLQKDERAKGGKNEMDRIRCLFKKWVPAEEYGRTVNPGAPHHAAQQFLKSHD